MINFTYGVLFLYVIGCVNSFILLKESEDEKGKKAVKKTTFFYFLDIFWFEKYVYVDGCDPFNFLLIIALVTTLTNVSFIVIAPPNRSKEARLAEKVAAKRCKLYFRVIVIE